MNAENARTHLWIALGTTGLLALIFLIDYLYPNPPYRPITRVYVVWFIAIAIYEYRAWLVAIGALDRPWWTAYYEKEKQH